MSIDLQEEIALKAGNITVQGISWSGLYTYIMVPQYKLLLDVGRCPRHAAHMDTLLLSHCHVDHIGAIARYINLREMQNLPPPRIYVPGGKKMDVIRVLTAMDKVEDRKTDRVNFFENNVFEVYPGEEYEKAGQVFFKVYDVDHSVKSVGYRVFERRKRLMKQFIGLAPDEIITLKKKGTKVEEYYDAGLLTWVGDSTGKTFDISPELFNSEVVITECTYASMGHLSLASKNKHTHVLEIAANSHLLEECKHLILKHFSMRYSTKEEIREGLKSTLPEDIWAKTHLLL